MSKNSSDPKEIQNDDRMWFVRMSTGAVFGPVNTSGLVQWAAEGRIMPDDEVSDESRTSWKSAQEIPEAGMDLLVERSDGSMMGPFHPDAIKHLIEEGKIPPNGKTFPKSELKARLAARQMSLFSEAEIPAAESPEKNGAKPRKTRQKTADAGDDGVAEENPAAAAEISALKAQLEELAGKAADAEKEHERESETLRAEIETLNQRLGEAKAREDEYADKSEKAEKTAGEKESLLDEIESLKKELDNAVGLHSAAVKSADEMLRKHDREVNALRLEIGELEKKLTEAEAVKARNSADGGILKSLEHEADVLRAESERLKKELENANSAREELVKKADEAGVNAVGLREELSVLRGEYGALLEYSNSRDAEYTARISASEGTAKSSSESAAGVDSSGIGRMQELEKQLADSYKEVETLKLSLKVAETEARSAETGAGSGDENLKQLAEAALVTLETMLDREREADEDARAASAGRQDRLRSEIERLRGATSISEGEPTTLERAEHRNEMLISRLRQELESERRVHQTELSRSSERIRELEGKVVSLEKSEAVARGQLELAKNSDTGTGLDSLESQLRRRESMILEMERNFEKERQNWQSAEETLTRRIEDLESASGLLVPAETPKEETNDPGKKRMPGWLSILHK